MSRFSFAGSGLLGGFLWAEHSWKMANRFALMALMAFMNGAHGSCIEMEFLSGSCLCATCIFEFAVSMLCWKGGCLLLTSSNLRDVYFVWY